MRIIQVSFKPGSDIQFRGFLINILPALVYTEDIVEVFWKLVTGKTWLYFICSIYITWFKLWISVINDKYFSSRKKKSSVCYNLVSEDNWWGDLWKSVRASASSRPFFCGEKKSLSSGLSSTGQACPTGAVPLLGCNQKAMGESQAWGPVTCVKPMAKLASGRRCQEKLILGKIST